MYADKIKGNSAEITFELSESDALSIIRKAIRDISFENGDTAEMNPKREERSADAAQEKEQNLQELTKQQRQKELLEAYEKTNRSHEEILHFLLGADGEDGA